MPPQLNPPMNTRNITRPKFTPALPMVLCGIVLSSIPVHADNGTWSNVTTGGDWNTIANWSGGTIAGGVGSVATLQAPSPNAYWDINLDVDVTLGGITYQASGATAATGWNITSSSGYTLTFNTGTATVADLSVRGTQTISATIAGSQGFSKTGGGKLTISGNNTHSGVTQVRDGNLTLASDTAAGNSLIVATQASGQYPQLHLTGGRILANDIALRMNWYNTANDGAAVGGQLLYNDSGDSVLNGNITLDRYASTNAGKVHLIGIQTGANSLTINGNISGLATGGQANGQWVDPTRLQFRASSTAGVFIVNGAISDGDLTTGGLSVYTTDNNVGTLRLAGANTYTGNTKITAGNFTLADTGALTFDVAKGNQLKLTTTGTVSLDGLFNVDFGSLLPTDDTAVTLVSATGSAATYGETFALNITSDSSATVVLTFANNYQAASALGNWAFDLGTGSLSFVAGAAIPEPAVIGAILGLATFIIAARFRRHAK